MIGDRRIIENAKWFDDHAVTQDAILNHSVWTNLTATTDAAGPKNMGNGTYNSVSTNTNATVDRGSGRIMDAHAIQHELLTNALS